MYIVQYDQPKTLPHFDLRGILPEGERLALEANLGILSLMRGGDIVSQQWVTLSELSILLPLLDHYPDYTPYEVLLTSFDFNSVDQEEVVKSRQRLYKAMRDGTFEQEMRPVRNVTSRLRIKLRTMGISILSLLETGYMLRPYHRKTREHI